MSTANDAPTIAFPPIRGPEWIAREKPETKPETKPQNPAKAWRF